MDDLAETARWLVSPRKGIFAADASPATLQKRGDEVGLDLSVPEKRWEYRKLTILTPSLGEYISGVILHDEIVRIPESIKILENAGIVPGIKVDGGIKDGITMGLDGLEKRLEEYKMLGVKFTKWRMVVQIGKSSDEEILLNIKGLAQYAYLAQKAGMIPIVEPEVVMEGDHSLEKCAEVTGELGRKVCRELLEQRVDFAGMIYKPNMILPGEMSMQKISDSEVALKTVGVLKKTISVGIPGIAFLSGGQDSIMATRRLNEIARIMDNPWRMTFSFERALEGPAMRNLALAQDILLHRAKMNSLASMGEYTEEAENAV